MPRGSCDDRGVTQGYNPYQPPQQPYAQQPPPSQVAPASGQPLPWSIGDVLSSGWAVVKEQWVVLIFAPLLAGFIGGFIGGFMEGIFGAMDMAAVGGLLDLGARTVVGAFFAVGTTRIFLTAARGEPAQFGTLFGGGDRFVQVLIVQILSMLCIFAGMLLLVVPGIIAALGLTLAVFFCVDQNMEPMDALKASWAAMTGHKGSYFLYGIVAVFLMIAGLLAFLVGAFVAGAVVQVGTAIIYLRLTGQRSVWTGA